MMKIEYVKGFVDGVKAGDQEMERFLKRYEMVLSDRDPYDKFYEGYYKCLEDVVEDIRLELQIGERHG